VNKFKFADMLVGGEGNCAAYALSIARSALGYYPPVPGARQDTAIMELNRIIGAFPAWFPMHTVKLWTPSERIIAVTEVVWPRNVRYRGLYYDQDDLVGLVGFVTLPYDSATPGHLALGLPHKPTDCELAVVFDIV
jgi:hypothetical protein